MSCQTESKGEEYNDLIFFVWQKRAKKKCLNNIHFNENVENNKFSVLSGNEGVRSLLFGSNWLYKETNRKFFSNDILYIQWERESIERGGINKIRTKKQGR